jgi:hypothetical protein
MQSQDLGAFLIARVSIRNGARDEEKRRADGSSRRIVSGSSPPNLVEFFITILIIHHISLIGVGMQTVVGVKLCCK